MNPTYDPATGQTTSTPRYTKRAKIGVASLCALTVASLAGVAALALSQHDSPTAAAAPAAHTTAHTSSGPAHTVVVVHPPAAVAQLQKELAALNYYNGSIDGLDGPLTTQAVTYLQRDAGLPQTGQMNTATQAALQNFLIHGNSQMGA